MIKMMSSIPVDMKKVEKIDINKEILRVGMIAELDAVNLYEQLATMTDDKDIKEVLMDIAKEEKTHMGEFQAMLLRNDKQQIEELKKGKDEVDKTTK
jgi:rubrerythrin